MIEQSATSGHLFCFCNAARNRVRLLWWDGSGFFIATKRVERGTFNFPKSAAAVAQLTVEQLQAMLRDIQFTRPDGNYWR